MSLSRTRFLAAGAPLFFLLSACSGAEGGPATETQEAAAGAAEAGTGDAETRADGGVGPGADGGPSGDGAAGPQTFTDPRDGKSYPTLTVGAKTWLAKNLDHAITGSYCYGDDPQRCVEHGRLYTWAAAQTACPSGTHLGTDDEWKSLEAGVGMAADQLELEGYSTPRGVREGETLKDPRGFGATMAGFRAGAAYDALDNRTYFWTASTRAGDVWRRRIAAATPTVFRFTNPPSTFAISVRCVLD